MALSTKGAISLALEVIPKLESIAHELANNNASNPEARKFCTEFRVGLLTIQIWLESEVPSNVSCNKIQKLLKNLERVCLYPVSVASTHSQFPSLQTLKKTALESRVLKAKVSLRKLACASGDVCKSHRKDLLRFLKSFNQHQSPEDCHTIPGAADVHKEDETIQEDYTYYVKVLYNALHGYSLCHKSGNAKELVTRLCLDHGPVHKHGYLDFKMLFLAHPHTEVFEQGNTWQDTRIRAVRTMAVKFENVQYENATAIAIPEMSPITTNEFCELISGQDQSCLCLKVHEEKLVYEQHLPRDIREWILDRPSVSLAQILSKGRLTHRMRLLLSLILAKAVWQFYDSRWMTETWTKDCVHFMYTYEADHPSAQLYAGKPFLSPRFNKQEHQNSSRGRIYKYPKILSLGIILLEIELDITIESCRKRAHMRPDGEPNINTDFTTADIVFNDKDRWQDTFPRHKALIGDCLTAEKFEVCTDIEKERDAIYKHVVAPLKELLNLWEGLDGISLDLISLPKSLAIEGAAALDAPLRILTSDRPLLHNSARAPGFTMSFPGSKAAAADEWFKKVEEMCILMGTTRRSREYDRVKIAILDTGINECNPYRNSIKGYEDFVKQGNKEGIDNTGHGTNSIHLMLKILPVSDIYVARVFEEKEANISTPILMAKAIRHAIREWKVDIIVMPFGFKDEYQDMRKAILEAQSNNILVFAAASNYGNTDYITFPANMYGNVMCMFSSTGFVKESRDFNPAPSEMSKLNFCMLGEEVEKVGDSMSGIQARHSGTSISTVIAAAVAALVIDFSREQDCQLLIRNRDDLKTVAGMTAIFREMARGGKDNGYHCVAPWKLLESVQGIENEDLRRGKVCETIYRLLRGKNKG